MNTRRLLSAFLFAAALVAFNAGAFAQSPNPGTPVRPDAQRNDAAQYLQGPFGGAAACNTVNSTVANMTITSVTPPANSCVYITGLMVDIYANATGAASTATASLTNVNGSPFWSLGTLATAANVNAGTRQIADNYSVPVKSQVPGTAVVWAPSAQNAQTVYCPRLAYYVAPCQ